MSASPVTTVVALAKACGVSTRTVRRWKKEGIPGGAGGPWVPADVRKWSAQRRSQSAERGGLERHGIPAAPAGAPAGAEDDEAKPDPLRSARTRDMQLRVAERMLALRKQKGELVERAIVNDLLGARAQEFLRQGDAAFRAIAFALSQSDSEGECLQMCQDAFNSVIARVYERSAELGHEQG